MQTQHHVIVVATPAFGHAQCRKQRRRARPRRPYMRQQRGRHRRKILAHAPNTILGRIDVAKDAQNALAMVGARRKSIDVQTRIVSAPGYAATHRGLGTKTRSRAAHVLRVARAKSDQLGERKRCSPSCNSNATCGNTNTPPRSNARIAVCCASGVSVGTHPVRSSATIAVIVALNGADRTRPSETRRWSARIGALRESPIRQAIAPVAYRPRRTPSASKCGSCRCRPPRCRARRT